MGRAKVDKPAGPNFRPVEKPISQPVAKSGGKTKSENITMPSRLMAPVRGRYAADARQVRGISPNLPYYRPARFHEESPFRHSGRMKHVYTTEDHEAVRHITEKSSSGTFEDLPRAARVAMILRADELIRTDGRRSRVVESLAASVRSGRPEVAANFSPRKLERILGGLLGGRQNALRSLWTPEIAGMVEKYHFDRKVIQEKLGRLEKAVSEGEPERPVAAAELAVPASEHAGVSSEPAIQAPPSRTDNYSIANLFRRNDLLHLNSQAENRRRHLAERSAAKTERTLPAAGGEPARGDVSLPTEGSPPRRSAASPASPTESARKTTNDRRRLEGTLKLVSQNGETFGTAELSGSDYNG
jgi:hypothetical protein